MSEMTELLPCPICGKKVYIGLYGDEQGYWWMVHGGRHYDECNCRLFMESCKFELEDETRAEYDEHAMNIRGGLARRWNQRHVETCENESLEFFGTDSMFKCSACDEDYPDLCDFNYCPFCGRKVVDNAD